MLSHGNFWLHEPFSTVFVSVELTVLSLVQLLQVKQFLLIDLFNTFYSVLEILLLLAIPWIVTSFKTNKSMRLGKSPAVKHFKFLFSNGLHRNDRKLCINDKIYLNVTMVLESTQWAGILKNLLYFVQYFHALSLWTYHH